MVTAKPWFDIHVNLGFRQQHNEDARRTWERMRLGPSMTCLWQIKVAARHLTLTKTFAHIGAPLGAHNTLVHNTTSQFCCGANNLSQGNWPRAISAIRGAMHLNATNAEILLQMFHSSAPWHLGQYFARLPWDQIRAWTWIQGTQWNSESTGIVIGQGAVGGVHNFMKFRILQYSECCAIVLLYCTSVPVHCTQPCLPSRPCIGKSFHLDRDQTHMCGHR